MRSLVLFAALLSVVQAVSIPGLLGRGSRDTCGEVNGPLNFFVSPDTVTVGTIDTCLCSSNIEDFMTTDHVASTAVQLFGHDVAASAIKSMVSEVGKECTYPDGSLPQCSPNDPCDFSCTNGFTRSGSKCECAAPMQICNGVCSDTASCPSSTPGRKRAENLWQKRVFCDVGFTACGTTSFYRKSLGAYECIDTQTDLESCGGCDIPLHKNSPRGQDCSSIPGVADVACYNGACRIYECMPGYTVSSDQSTCRSKEQLKIIQDLIENPYKMAIDFI